MGMKNREEHVLEQFGIFENYENCAEQAFTRSEIVQGWNYELKEHRLYCRSEIEQMGFYQRRFSEKYGTRSQNDEQNINKTIKQKMFLTNRKSFQHQPMRKRRQY